MNTITTKSNWQKFDSAFNQVSSYVVLDAENKSVVAKIALKYPKDGAGRVSCYMHIIGNEVQIGTASGYGYDKRTTSIIDASNKCWNAFDMKFLNSASCEFIELLQSTEAQSGWQEVINGNNGFIVIQAI